MGRLFLLVAAVLIVVGCGKDQPTRNDAETVTAMLYSSALVQSTLEPLYYCPPENIRCFTTTGPKVVTVAERENGASTPSSPTPTTTV